MSTVTRIIPCLESVITLWDQEMYNISNFNINQAESKWDLENRNTRPIFRPCGLNIGRQLWAFEGKWAVWWWDPSMMHGTNPKRELFGDERNHFILTTAADCVVCNHGRASLPSVFCLHCISPMNVICCYWCNMSCADPYFPSWQYWLLHSGLT